MFPEKCIQTSCKFLMYERFSTKSLPDKYTPVEMYCNIKGRTKTVRNKRIEDIFSKFMIRYIIYKFFYGIDSDLFKSKFSYLNGLERDFKLFAVTKLVFELD